MKQVKFILPLLLAFAALGNVWGASPETVTFTNKDWAPWTNVTSGSSFESTGSARGVANNGVNGSCTSTSSYSNVTKIEVVASSNTTGGKVAIKIGSTQVANKSIANSNNATYTFDATDLSTISSLSGNITIVVTKPSSKTVYVKSIKITYSSSSTYTLLFSSIRHRVARLYRAYHPCYVFSWRIASTIPLNCCKSARALCTFYYVVDYYPVREKMQSARALSIHFPFRIRPPTRDKQDMNKRYQTVVICLPYHHPQTGKK